MNNNPYAPPRAPVDDLVNPQASMQRPRQVVLAVQLAAASFVVGLAVMFLTWDFQVALRSPLQIVLTQIFALALLVWLYAKVYAGRNWARITILVLTSLGMLAIFSPTALKVYESLPMIAKAWRIVGYGLNLIILWLLFLSPGKEWFRKRAATP